jgi:hypothetical protein
VYPTPCLRLCSIQDPMYSFFPLSFSGPSCLCQKRQCSFRTLQAKTLQTNLTWRIHGSVEDTKLSTNKQHSLSFRDRKLDGNYTRYQDAGGGCESSPSVATSCVFRAISAHIAPQFSQLREGLSTIKRSSLTIMGKKDEEERRRRRILPSGSHHRNATEIPH